MVVIRNMQRSPVIKIFTFDNFISKVQNTQTKITTHHQSIIINIIVVIIISEIPKTTLQTF